MEPPFPRHICKQKLQLFQEQSLRLVRPRIIYDDEEASEATT
jgi:hypothetical protein